MLAIVSCVMGLGPSYYCKHKALKESNSISRRCFNFLFETIAHNAHKDKQIA
jgi:hypothetical protein